MVKQKTFLFENYQNIDGHEHYCLTVVNKEQNSPFENQKFILEPSVKCDKKGIDVIAVCDNQETTLLVNYKTAICLSVENKSNLDSEIMDMVVTSQLETFKKVLVEQIGLQHNQLKLSKNTHFRLASMLHILRNYSGGILNNVNQNSVNMSNRYKRECVSENALIKAIEIRRSTRTFSSRLPDLEKIKSMIYYTFGPFKNYKRYLPSAGGYESVKPTIIALDNRENCKIYTVCRESGLFMKDSMTIRKKQIVDFLNKGINEEFSDSYCGYFIGLAVNHNNLVAKYGFKGYDLALLETGMALESLLLLGQDFGLVSCVLGGSDTFLNYMLDKQGDDKYLSGVFIGGS